MSTNHYIYFFYTAYKSFSNRLSFIQGQRDFACIGRSVSGSNSRLQPKKHNCPKWILTLSS